MIGDTPQPGETPRDEGDPWSFADPGTSWWRGETDPPTGRPERHPRGRGAQDAPQNEAQPLPGGTGTLLPPGGSERKYTGAAAEAHAAGTRDAAEELDPGAEPGAVERDHNRPDPHRYDPLRPPAGHTPEPAAEKEAAEKEAAEKEAAEKEEKGEPDVMVLPEPNTRNRPTVPLERTPIRQNRRGGHPTEPLPRPTGSPRTDARLERLENSPFWHTDPEATEERLEERPTHAGSRRRARRRSGRPVGSLVALIALGLLAAFFGWVSAEPFWLAMGHGDRGYATTTHCTGNGVTQRCTGRFAAADGRFTISRVTLLGVGPGERVPGTVAPARMVSPDSRRVYLGDTSPLLQLRWLLGFTLVLFCGYAIAGITGARRLETGRARRGAVLASLAGPVLLLAGFLIAAY